MIWTVLALLSMIVLGGFISYYGDLQGRRWGKKRVSWFGMRPKHTAILITSLTGAFIALFSVVTMLLISPTVREVVVRGERLIQENKQLNTEYEKKRRFYEAREHENTLQAASAKTELESRQADLVRGRQELSRTQQEIAANQREIAAMSRRNSELQVVVSQRAQAVRKGAAEVAALTQKKAALEKQQRVLIAQRETLKMQRAQYEDNNKILGRQSVNLVRENTRLAKNNSDMLKNNAAQLATNIKLKNESDLLTHANDALKEANKNLIASTAEAERLAKEKAQKLEARILQLTQELNRRQEELAGLRNNATSAESQYTDLRQRPIQLRTGELLARRTVDAHMRPEAVRRELQALVEDADKTALLRGATPGLNGRAALLVNRRGTALAGLQISDERAALNALADKLRGQNTRFLLTASTLTNTIRGEQALITLDFREVVPVYQKGETVVQSAPIDARKPVGQVVNVIVQFLQQDVRNAAQKKGILPQIDLETGAQQVGIVGPAELFELTDKIRRMGGRVQITAVATQPLDSADPLQLDFKLSRPTAKP